MLSMFLMARQATETFVDANGSAVVAGMHFSIGERRVALVAESLARIGADLHRPAGIKHGRQRKKSDGEAEAFAAVKESERRASEFFAGSKFRFGIVVILFAERVAEAVDGVAGEARDGVLVNGGGGQKLPGTVGVKRRDEIADATFKEHAVTAKTIVHQQAIVIVLGIEEYFLVRDTMRAVLPLGGFLLMAFLAAANHGVDVNGAEANGIAISAANVLNEAANIAQVEAGIKGEDFAVARATRDGAVTGCLPGRVLGTDFVTTGAGFSSGVFVVEAGGGESKNDENADDECKKSQAGVEESHG